jgi:hypothetical protein
MPAAMMAPARTPVAAAMTVAAMPPAATHPAHLLGRVAGHGEIAQARNGAGGASGAGRCATTESEGTHRDDERKQQFSHFSSSMFPRQSSGRPIPLADGHYGLIFLPSLNDAIPVMVALPSAAGRTTTAPRLVPSAIAAVRPAPITRMAQPCAVAPVRSAPEAFATAARSALTSGSPLATRPIKRPAGATARTIPTSVSGRIEALSKPPAAARPVRSRGDFRRNERNKGQSCQD